jgi:predicted metalloprotease
MAMWEKIDSRGDVEDRRSSPMALGALGTGGVLLVIIFSLVTGIDPSSALEQVQNIAPQTQTEESSEFAGEDSYEVFASTVLGSNNDMWSEIFAQKNLTYTAPKLVLFRQATQSGCGVATSDVGPHYCPLDQTIYLDETFFEELENQLGAEGGDVAEAYVISHEVGHHAQNLQGLFDKVDASSNSNSVKVELQADCYAGLWAESVKDKGIFLPGEIEEAIDAAEAVGDDRIQEKTSGQINKETWTHGSSKDRVKWFNEGYENGDIKKCNTF